MNIVKVKYVLSLNHSEIPRQYHYVNVATVKMTPVKHVLWSPGVHINEVSLYTHAKSCTVSSIWSCGCMM